MDVLPIWPDPKQKSWAPIRRCHACQHRSPGMLNKIDLICDLHHRVMPKHSICKDFIYHQPQPWWEEKEKDERI